MLYAAFIQLFTSHKRPWSSLSSGQVQRGNLCVASQTSLPTLISDGQGYSSCWAFGLRSRAAVHRLARQGFTTCAALSSPTQAPRPCARQLPPKRASLQTLTYVDFPVLVNALCSDPSYAPVWSPLGGIDNELSSWSCHLFKRSSFPTALER